MRSRSFASSNLCIYFALLQRLLYNSGDNYERTSRVGKGKANKSEGGETIPVCDDGQVKERAHKRRGHTLIGSLPEEDERG